MRISIKTLGLFVIIEGVMKDDRTTFVGVNEEDFKSLLYIIYTEVHSNRKEFIRAVEKFKVTFSTDIFKGGESCEQS